jgi:cell division protein ZapA
MAQVTLRINGYAYTLGCKDGEEAHLQDMAAEVDRRIEGVKTTAGPSGEARMLVIAALLMADELDELQKKIRDETSQGGSPASDPKLGRRLGKLAKRAEEIAANLEHS